MNTIEIYTKGYCPFCKMAKKTLNSLNVSFEEFDITHNADKALEMQERSQRLTVPQIFIGDQHLGGNDDLQDALRNGQLKKLLQTLSIEV